jgi:3-dehydrosphinganine reductase
VPEKPIPISAQLPQKVAVISGGSSGIGLACARVLLKRGFRLVLLARDLERLQRAQSELAANDPGLVDVLPVDVTDAAAVRDTIERIGVSHGRIDWLITSAGMAEPGFFRDLDLSVHREQMETNYFGTLHLIHAALPLMRGRDGRITLVSSGAAFVGIAGYSGYAPGKFALRALAEILRLELAPERIAVSITFPPDTDTPQLEHERTRRPAVTRLVSEQGGVMAASRVAELIVKRAERGAFIIAPSWPIALLAWFHSIYRPVLAWQQRRILKKTPNGHVGEGRT